MNIDHILDELNAAQGKPLEASKPMVKVIYTLIGTAYRFTRTFGKTPEETMRLILWTLFYFVQQEHRLTAEDEESVLIAMAAAENSFAFCGEPKKEGK